MDPEIRRHQQLLIKISENMDQTEGSQEFESFDTALASLLPKGIRARNATILKKLEALTTRGSLKPGKYDELKKICRDANSHAIVAIIEDAEKEMSTGGSGDQDGVFRRNIDSTKSTSVTAKRPNEASSGEESGTSKRRKRGSSDDGSPYLSDALFKKRNGKGYYDTDGKKGFLLILNSKHEREGTDEDVIQLKAFFGDVLKFDIDDPRSRQPSDLTPAQLQRCLKIVREKLNKQSKEYYCFICVIMSHGNEHGITMGGGQYDVSQIRPYFNNINMPKFAGRPKIFFLQACRGSRDMGYVMAADNEPEDEPEDMDIDEYRKIYEIPIEADTLLAYASTPGHRSYRDTRLGSLLISTCVETFQENWKNDHLEEMMITVKERIADREVKLVLEDMTRLLAKQMPCTWSTLTKRLLFTPHYNHCSLT